MLDDFIVDYQERGMREGLAKIAYLGHQTHTPAVRHDNS
jgi:hypothetical protein